VLKDYAAAGFDSASQVKAMDVEGLDVAVLFRTLPVVCVDAFDPEFAIALCRGWNDWAADFVRPAPDRMKAAALLTLHDATLAAQELRRAVTQLGFVAAQMMPNPVNGVNLHDPKMDPLLGEGPAARRADLLPPRAEQLLDTHFVNRFLTRPSATMSGGLNNPVELMAAIASMTAGACLERFPRPQGRVPRGQLLVAALAALADRRVLADVEERRDGQAPGTAQRVLSPAMLHQRGRRRDQVEWVVKKLGDDTLVFSTDYPHSDSHFPEATSLFLKLPLSEESKRKILWDNCARLYGFN
jgi:hypothetical protein